MAKNTPKLTAEQREDRKALKAQLKAIGGRMFTFPSHNFVVVIAPAMPGRADSEYVKFSIAECSDEDNFRAKVGQFLALGRFFVDGQTMSRRVMGYWNSSPDLEAEAMEIVEFFTGNPVVDISLE